MDRENIAALWIKAFFNTGFIWVPNKSERLCSMHRFSPFSVYMGTFSCLDPISIENFA